MSSAKNTQIQDVAKRLMQTGWEQLSQNEQHVIEAIVNRAHLSRNINREFDDKRTFGEHLADRIAAFGGSWTFIIIFFAILMTWIVINSLILAHRGTTFDQYPYILLNLVLSMLAALQAPVIMMSQNRQAVKDRLDAAHDYEVNLKAELEIVALHEKIDHLRESQWAELVVMQQEQINLLKQLLEAHIASHSS